MRKGLVDKGDIEIICMVRYVCVLGVCVCVLGGLQEVPRLMGS